MPIAVSRDHPRYRYIITLCNYVNLTLLLGMIIVLAGVMLITYSENKKQKDDYNEKKIEMAKILGIILFVFGSLFFIASFVTLIVAAINYMRARNEPISNEQDLSAAEAARETRAAAQQRI